MNRMAPAAALGLAIVSATAAYALPADDRAAGARPASGSQRSAGRAITKAELERLTAVPLAACGPQPSAAAHFGPPELDVDCPVVARSHADPPAGLAPRASSERQIRSRLDQIGRSVDQVTELP